MPKVYIALFFAFVWSLAASTLQKGGNPCEDTADCGVPGAGICVPAFMLRRAAMTSRFYEQNNYPDLRSAGYPPASKSVDAQIYTPYIRTSIGFQEPHVAREIEPSPHAVFLKNIMPEMEERYTTFNASDDLDATGYCICTSCFTGANCQYQLKSQNTAYYDCSWGGLFGTEMKYLGRTNLAAGKITMFTVSIALFIVAGLSLVVVGHNGVYINESRFPAKRTEEQKNGAFWPGYKAAITLFMSLFIGCAAFYGLCVWNIIDLSLIHSNLLTDSHGELLCSA